MAGVEEVIHFQPGDKPYYLECTHCGHAAISKSSDEFTDGEGEKCETCDFPGHVSIDDHDEEEIRAEWVISEETDAFCNDTGCWNCGEIARKEIIRYKSEIEKAHESIKNQADIIAELRHHWDLSRNRNLELQAEIEAMRETNARLNRRCQAMEAAIHEKTRDAMGRSMGRALANAAYLGARDEALEEAAEIVKQADRDMATYEWVLEQIRAKKVTK